MKTVSDVVEHWRQWRKGLAYVFLVAGSVRVHVQVGLELRGVDEDEEIAEMRRALPGWGCDWTAEDRVRLTPPPFGGGR